MSATLKVIEVEREVNSLEFIPIGAFTTSTSILFIVSTMLNDAPFWNTIQL